MKRLIGKNQRIVAIPVIFVSFLTLGLISALTFAPVVKSNAAESSAEVETIVRPVLAITTDESLLNFTLSPLAGGSSESKPVVATVDTNSTGGYELYFSSEDNATAMTSTTASDTIVSDFNSAVTLANMGVNKWGYSLDNTNFNKIPTLANQTKIKDLNHFPTSNERNTTVNIGIKIDDTIDSGIYSKAVKFSAIAHPSAVPTLHQITTMQQMSSEVCAATTTPLVSVTALDWDGSYHGDNTRVPRNSLQDTRDGKYYLVSKLADGNCWMSQNLEFILTANVAITNENTDLNTKTSWTPTSSTLTNTPNTDVWPITYTAARSYYPIASDRYYRNGTTKSSSPTGSGAAYDWEKTGVYYNWFAATAGSGTSSMISGNVNDSICPKGWRLPYGKEENKSYHKLVTTIYGASGSSIVAAPLNFLRGGYVDGGMSAQAYYGHLWTSTAGSQNQANNLYLYPQNVIAQSSDVKGYGFNVRCVAR